MSRSLAARPVVAALSACGLSAEDVARDQEVQPLVYLMQRAGAPLSYRFTWEEIGPFSEALAAEIHELVHDLASEPDSEPSDAAVAVRPLLEPASEDMTRSSWLHLLMCVDFLRRRAHRPVLNGDQPALLTANFTEAEIAKAKERLDVCAPRESGR